MFYVKTDSNVLIYSCAWFILCSANERKKEHINKKKSGSRFYTVKCIFGIAVRSCTKSCSVGKFQFMFKSIYLFKWVVETELSPTVSSSVLPNRLTYLALLQCIKMCCCCCWSPDLAAEVLNTLDVWMA